MWPWNFEKPNEAQLQAQAEKTAKRNATLAKKLAKKLADKQKKQEEEAQGEGGKKESYIDIDKPQEEVKVEEKKVEEQKAPGGKPDKKKGGSGQEKPAKLSLLGP